MSESVDRRNFLKKTGVALGAAAAAGAIVGRKEAAAKKGDDGPFAFGNQVNEIRKRGKITIGTSMKVAPQTYRDKKTGEPKGYDIDVGRMIAKDLEVEAEFVEFESGPVSIAGLIAGKYDIVITGLANKPQRAQALQFTRGYVPYDLIMLVKSDMNVNHWEELNKPGIKITGQLGASSEFRAKEAFPKAEIVSLNQIEQFLEVAAGRADAALGEAYLVLPFAENHPSTKVLRGPGGKPLEVAREWGCIPVRQGEHAFMHYLDNWLYWYQERRTLDALYDKIVGPALRGETYWK
jgi:polar amino acid transport system substrate-binding protein